MEGRSDGGARRGEEWKGKRRAKEWWRERRRRATEWQMSTQNAGQESRRRYQTGRTRPGRSNGDPSMRQRGPINATSETHVFSSSSKSGLSDKTSATHRENVLWIEIRVLPININNFLQRVSVRWRFSVCVAHRFTGQACTRFGQKWPSKSAAR